MLFNLDAVRKKTLDIIKEYVDTSTQTVDIDNCDIKDLLLLCGPYFENQQLHSSNSLDKFDYQVYLMPCPEAADSKVTAMWGWLHSDNSLAVGYALLNGTWHYHMFLLMGDKAVIETTAKPREIYIGRKLTNEETFKLVHTEWDKIKELGVFDHLIDFDGCSI